MVEKQKLKFQFCSSNPPFWNPEKPLLSGWVGGWVGGWVVIKRVLRFPLFFSMLSSKMSLFQKWCQKLSTAFLSKVMSILKFQNSTKIEKLRSITTGKTDKKIFDQKGVSAQRKLSSFFKKNVIKKQWFQEQKHEKYFKFKNGSKKLLGAFNQKLWAI